MFEKQSNKLLLKYNKNLIYYIVHLGIFFKCLYKKKKKKEKL